MAEITWTDEAQRWLTDIFEYIAADNRQAATRTVQGIYDRAQELRRFPEIGSRYTVSSRNVRVLLYGHYRIAYLIKDDGNVDILGVFHGSLDIYQVSTLVTHNPALNPSAQRRCRWVPAALRVTGAGLALR